MKKYSYKNIVNLYEQLNGYKNINANIPDVSFLFKRFKDSYHGVLIIDNTNAIILNKNNLASFKSKICSDFILPDDLPMNIFTIIIDSFKVTKTRYMMKNVCALDMVTGKRIHNGMSRDFQIEEALLSAYETRAMSECTWIENVVSPVEKKHIVILTFLLVLLNAGVFGYLYTRENEALGISAANVLMQGESYRLFSYMFLHAGIFHLISNMIALIIFGNEYEKRNGFFKTATIYVFGGVYAGIISVAMSVLTSNYEAITVGASGAIFALLGAYVCDLLSDKSINRGRSKLILIYSIYMLLSGFFRGNVDVACHIGGFMAGLIMQKIFVLHNGIIYGKQYVKNTKKIIDNDMRFITKRL